MGQRLNLEFTASGKVLANAYYHWSGYTNSSVELMKQVLTSETFKDKTISPIIKAVKLLEETGAGINLTEEENIKKSKLPKELADYKFKDCESRNEGILAVTEKGIKETQSWAEGAVRIDLETNRILFTSLFEVNEEYYDEDEIEEIKTKAIDLPYNLFDMSIDEALEFAKLVEEHIWNYKNNNGIYYSAIY